MMQLQLKTSDKVIAKLSGFAHFLEAYDLNIIGSETGSDGSIELNINVGSFHAARLVNNLAYEFFEDAVAGCRIEYITKQKPEDFKQEENTRVFHKAA